jgi:hypothetical protein
MLELEQIPDKSNIPSDVIRLEWDQFLASIHYYTLKAGILVQDVLNLNTKKWEALAPFKYNKPVWRNILDPDHQWDSEYRKWYHPLGIIERDIYRWPNHWHRPDNGLFCAVEGEKRWETRYFPKTNLFPDDTWEKAIRILWENS